MINKETYPNRKYPFTSATLYNSKGKLTIGLIEFQEGSWSSMRSYCSEANKSLIIPHYNPILFSKNKKLLSNNQKAILKGNVYLAIVGDIGSRSISIEQAKDFSTMKEARGWCSQFGGVDTLILKAERYEVKDWCGKAIGFLLKERLDFYF